jgi:hypothetical protein
MGQNLQAITSNGDISKMNERFTVGQTPSNNQSIVMLLVKLCNDKFFIFT